MSFPDNVRIVLVQPESPGNIGAAARALKAMGMSQLVLVKPVCNPHCDEARWLAHNAADTLAKAQVVDTLEEALAETVVSIATTRRLRRQGQPYLTPEEAAALLQERTQPIAGESVAGPAGEPASPRAAAIVFGRESSGLTNEELAACSLQSTIPAHADQQSLNLAQAVMLYAYMLYQRSLRPSEREFPWELATHTELEGFYRKLGPWFERMGVKPASTMDNFVSRFRRVLSRFPLESRDVQLLHMLLVDPPHEQP